MSCHGALPPVDSTPKTCGNFAAQLHRCEQIASALASFRCEQPQAVLLSVWPLLDDVPCRRALLPANVTSADDLSKVCKHQFDLLCLAGCAVVPQPYGSLIAMLLSSAATTTSLGSGQEERAVAAMVPEDLAALPSSSNHAHSVRSAALPSYDSSHGSLMAISLHSNVDVTPPGMGPEGVASADAQALEGQASRVRAALPTALPTTFRRAISAHLALLPPFDHRFNLLHGNPHRHRHLPSLSALPSPSASPCHRHRLRRCLCHCPCA